ncbi:MAG: type II toxin-antitoxin system HicA family toxin [Vulcanimicrobiota bacterium]
MAKFPSMKSKKLFAILSRSPLNYCTVYSKGSHKKLVSASGYPDLRYAFHDNETISGGLVRDILCDDVGLSEVEAFNLI